MKGVIRRAAAHDIGEEMSETVQAVNEEEPLKLLDLKEFVEFGYLQEVNRAFFHPRGLALAVWRLDEGSYAFAGIWDYRADPEGMVFDDLDPEKARRVSEDLEKRKPVREAALGFWQQPLTA